MMSSLRKLFRYSAIYGPGRALFKAVGRLRLGRAPLHRPWRRPARRDIGIIGCGQFAFATIGYVITRRFGRRIAASFDPDPRAVDTFATFYGCAACASADEVLRHPDIRTVYIASNHSSHAPYAAEALRAGKDVVIEKPLAVNPQQLEQLLDARARASGRLFAGYNRPFARAVRELKALCSNVQGPMTLTCTIAGHRIPPDHWYRDPREGTRICGNVGHWLDLMVHILSWRELPRDWRIACAWSDGSARDDNLAITLTSGVGDLVSIVLTSRSEPFEGVSESIFLSWGEVIASIDDFRSMTVRIGPRLVRRRYWPKDVGHAGAVLQPFEGEPRDFREVVASTELMLCIADMVRDGEHVRRFSFATAIGRDAAIQG
jgi:predicted dehydrogenase